VVVAGRLAGKTAIVISLPNASKTVRDQSVKVLTDAGAKVSGQIEVTGNFIDPHQATSLDELLKSLATGASVDHNQDVPTRAGAVLAGAVMSAEAGAGAVAGP